MEASATAGLRVVDVVEDTVEEDTGEDTVAEGADTVAMTGTAVEEEEGDTAATIATVVATIVTVEEEGTIATVEEGTTAIAPTAGTSRPLAVVGIRAPLALGVARVAGAALRGTSTACLLPVTVGERASARRWGRKRHARPELNAAAPTSNFLFFPPPLFGYQIHHLFKLSPKLLKEKSQIVKKIQEIRFANDVVDGNREDRARARRGRGA